MKKFIIIALVFVFTITSFSQDATRDSLIKLYIATFDRAPDVDGINYWANSNMELESIAQSFFDQDETRNKYPSGLSTKDFVTSIYKNLFNRLPDEEGEVYWVANLDTNEIINSVFILAVINGAKDDDAIILENKKEVGEYFILNELSDIPKAEEVMVDVTEDTTTIDDAKEKIDSYSSEEVENTGNSCSTLDYSNGKTPFDGVYVKVDSLGNVCVQENGVWKSFFPMIIYPASETDRPNYADYTVGGRFNTMIAYEVGQMVQIKEAGMRSLLSTDMYQDGAHFEGEFASAIDDLKSRGLLDNLLFYYTDYEGVRMGDWSWHEEKKAIITEKDPNGHPEYFLNGNPPYNPNSAEKVYLSGHQTSDILGAGIYERWNDLWVNGPDRLIQLGLGAQTNPVVIAQIAYGIGGPVDRDTSLYPRNPVGHRFTPLAMSAVAQGAKGVGFWQDYGSEVGVAVETNAWWDDLPKFNADIEKMMDANIVQSLHNPFSIICNSHVYTDKYDQEIVLDNIYEKDEWGYYLIPDDHLSASIGTRLINGKGYAIVSNWNSTEENFECTVNTSQMGYSFTKLYDFIDEVERGSVTSSTFKLSVPAYSWRVIEFK